MSIASPIASLGRGRIAPAKLAYVLNLVQSSYTEAAPFAPAPGRPRYHSTLRPGHVRRPREGEVSTAALREGPIADKKASSSRQPQLTSLRARQFNVRSYGAAAHATTAPIRDDHEYHDYGHFTNGHAESSSGSRSYDDHLAHVSASDLSRSQVSPSSESATSAHAEGGGEAGSGASTSASTGADLRKPPPSLSTSEYIAWEQEARPSAAYLVSRARLERMAAAWLDSATPHQAEYLHERMKEICDARDQGLDPEVRGLAIALGSWALVQLGRDLEAQELFDRMDRSRTAAKEQASPSEAALNLSAVTHGIAALALAKMGSWNEADARMSTSLRHALQAKSIGKRFSALESRVLDSYFRSCNASDRDDLILALVRNNQRVLRHPLGPAKAEKRNRLLVDTIFNGLRRISSPAATFEDSLSSEEDEVKEAETNSRRIGHILLNALAASPDHTDLAVRLVGVMKSRGIPLQPDAILQLVTRVGRSDPALASSLARDILRTESVPQSILRSLLGLHSAGLEKDVTRTVYDRLAESGYAFAQHELETCARAFASAGEVDIVRQILDEAFGPDKRSERRLSILFAAQASARDVDAARGTFEQIWTIKPSVPVAERMLALHASLGDLESTVQLFDTVMDIGLEPTVRGYTTLISLFAHRRDLVNAKNVFQVMIDSGVQPDAIAWAAILNAEVEAGEWSNAALRWSALPEPIKGHPGVASVILKAYVLLSAPTDQVLALFRSVRRPNAFTWSYAIQSALDNDDLELGQDLFLEMDQKARDDPSAPRPNVFTFSILLHAYLRKNMSDSAKGVYEEMMGRGIVPTSVTYGMVIASYATASSGSSLMDAQDFAMSLYRQSIQSSRGEAIRSRGTSAENLFGPLIESAGRTGDTESVHHFQDLIPEESATIKTYSQLMDAYRRAADPDSVLAIWDKAFDLACETIGTAKDERAGLESARVRPNVLCIPLSIVLDAMSAAGRYYDVKRVWKQVADAGFSYDSQNFNHYAIALARTGEIEGAFAIVHRVILPRAKEVRSRRAAALRQSESSRYDPDYDEADDYYSYDNGGEDERFQAVEPVFKPPNRRHQHRWDGLDIFRGPSATAEGTAGGHGRSASAAATNIEILQNWRPSDVLWHPNYMTLTVLELAYSQLEDARRSGAWMALASDESESDPDAATDAHLDTGSDETVASAGEKAVTFPAFHDVPMRSTSGSVSTATPMSMIVRLNRKYLRVVSLISLHRRKRAARQARDLEERRSEGRR